MSRESQREGGETLHHLVAPPHARDRFVVRNPPAWQSGHSGAGLRESRADQPAVTLGRRGERTVCQGSGVCGKHLTPV